MRSNSQALHHDDRMALKRLAAAALLVAAIGTASGRAHGADVYAAMRDPAVRAAVSICKPDRARLCAGVTRGGGRILRCLAAKPEQLSAECRIGMQRARKSLIAAGLVQADAAAGAPAAPPPASP